MECSRVFFRGSWMDLRWISVNRGRYPIKGCGPEDENNQDDDDDDDAYDDAYDCLNMFPCP